MKNTIFNWSGGKDACLALHYLKQTNDYNIVRLSTTINKSRRRITMHGVHEELLNAQVDALGYEVELIELPENISMNSYSRIMAEVSKNHKKDGIDYYAYGDINLIDLRKFRDSELEKSNLKSLYPLWNKNTKVLSQEFIDLGFKAIVVAISSEKLDKSFCGRAYDQTFLRDLPENVDPCGENGEFHTFVYDGPLFNKPLDILIGEKTSQTYTPSKEDEDCFCDESKQKNWNTNFWFCELTLKPKLTYAQ